MKDKTPIAKRVNWQNIKSWFLSSDGRSLRQASERYGVAYNSIRDKAAAEGWTEQKQAMLAKVDKKALELMPDKLAEFRVKQAELGELMQERGIEGLKSNRARSLKEAAEVADMGAKIEKDALGISNKEEQPEGLRRRFVAEEYFSDAITND